MSPHDANVDVTDGFQEIVTYVHPVQVEHVKPIAEPALRLASRRINGRGKRALDLAGGLFLFVFLLPFLLTLALLLGALRRESPLVQNARIGRRGRPFKAFMFRTRTGEGRTAFDRGLEAFGFHLLPALVNVIAGDMSLVGPAPVDNAGLAAYGADRRYYLITRPGLTCPWSGASNAQVAAACRDYVQNWRIRRDLRALRDVLLGRAQTA